MDLDGVSSGMNEKEKVGDKSHELTILIVEDEEINSIYLEELFVNIKGFDFNILHARNGKQAVDLCRENEDINLVLMDLKLPLMNGFEATNIIKKFRQELPVIAQTAYSQKSACKRLTTRFDRSEATEHRYCIPLP